MNRFENLTPLELADILNNKTNTTLVISQDIAQTKGKELNVITTMGMPVITDTIRKDMIEFNNEVDGRFAYFILKVTELEGKIYYKNINTIDAEMIIKF